MTSHRPLAASTRAAVRPPAPAPTTCTTARFMSARLAEAALGAAPNHGSNQCAAPLADDAVDGNRLLPHVHRQYGSIAHSSGLCGHRTVDESWPQSNSGGAFKQRVPQGPFHRLEHGKVTRLHFSPDICWRQDSVASLKRNPGTYAL